MPRPSQIGSRQCCVELIVAFRPEMFPARVGAGRAVRVERRTRSSQFPETAK